MTKMLQQRFTVRMLTPAFLGDAEQSARWRTPPFKHLLRQWWRVVWAADHNFANDIAAMRREEGLLFGHAWLEGDNFERDGREVTTTARKSQVRLRLDSWAVGKLRSWDGLERGTVHHPETEKTGYKVGPHAYLGYGPLDGRGGTCFSKKINAAIQAGESAVFSLAMPENVAPAIAKALGLMDRYGTLGGRSRNGWGSFMLIPQDDTGPLEVDLPLRPWKDCLDRDWPHAIGLDERGPLIWQTAPHADWKALMRTLAIIKIGLRTQFVLELRSDHGDKPKGGQAGIDHGRPQDRHWLSHPVTNHLVRSWGSNVRLPNSLRFKIRALPDGRLAGAIFHVPCLPPALFRPDLQAIIKTWGAVHALLDELTLEPKQRGYRIIADADRRTKLKPGLDGVTLQRSME